MRSATEVKPGDVSRRASSMAAIVSAFGRTSKGNVRSRATHAQHEADGVGDRQTHAGKNGGGFLLGGGIDPCANDGVSGCHDDRLPWQRGPTVTTSRR
jgi:hypothetical protein